MDFSKIFGGLTKVGLGFVPGGSILNNWVDDIFGLNTPPPPPPPPPPQTNTLYWVLGGVGVLIVFIVGYKVLK